MTVVEKGQEPRSRPASVTESRDVKVPEFDRHAAQQLASERLKKALEHHIPYTPKPPAPVVNEVIPDPLTFEDAVLEIYGSGFGEGGDVLIAWMHLPDGSSVQLPVTDRTDTRVTVHPIPGTWHTGSTTRTDIWVSRAGADSNMHPIMLTSTASVINDVGKADALPGETVHDLHAGDRLLITGSRFVPPIQVHYVIGPRNGGLETQSVADLVQPDDLTQIVTHVPEMPGVALTSECWVQVRCGSGISEWWGAPGLRYHATLVSQLVDFSQIGDLVERVRFDCSDPMALLLDRWELLPAQSPGQPATPRTVLHGHREGIVSPPYQQPPLPPVFAGGTDKFFVGRASVAGDLPLQLKNGWTVEEVVFTTTSNQANLLANLQVRPQVGAVGLATQVRWFPWDENQVAYDVCDYMVSIKIKGPVGVPYL